MLAEASASHLAYAAFSQAGINPEPVDVLSAKQFHERVNLAGGNLAAGGTRTRNDLRSQRCGARYRVAILCALLVFKQLQ